MDCLKCYLDKIEHDETKLEEFEKIICDTLDTLEVKCPHIYKHMIVQLHTLAFGDSFGDELAKEAVEKMVNVDGTKGEKFSRNLTDQWARELGVEDKSTYYYMCNYMASDYWNILGNSQDIYAKLAKAFIEDPDSTRNRALMMYLWK